MTNRPPGHNVKPDAGSRNAYNLGCRCSVCATDGRAANAAYQRRFRAGLTGTRADRIHEGGALRGTRYVPPN